MHLWQSYFEVKAGILYFYGSYEVRFPELPYCLVPRRQELTCLCLLMLEPGNLRKALASSFLLVMITSWDAINCLPVTAGWAGLIRSSGKCVHKRWTVPSGTMHQYLLPMWTGIHWDEWYGLIRGSGLCAVNEQLTVSDSRMNQYHAHVG